MQPYFLPYIGYWQLLAAVDRLVVYDNIQYTKQGWINRNRFLRNGAAAFFTVPLKKASASLNVADRFIADDFDPAALLNPLASAYKRGMEVAVLILIFLTSSPVTRRIRGSIHYLLDPR